MWLTTYDMHSKIGCFMKNFAWNREDDTNKKIQQETSLYGLETMRELFNPFYLFPEKIIEIEENW